MDVYTALILILIQMTLTTSLYTAADHSGGQCGSPAPPRVLPPVCLNMSAATIEAK